MRGKQALGLTAAGEAALKWMREHGGDVAVARVKGGGRYFLGQGEQAPFMPKTARQLIDAGLAEYVDLNGRKSVRFRLISPENAKAPGMTPKAALVGPSLSAAGGRDKS
jgi:hypothetical protein